MVLAAVCTRRLKHVDTINTDVRRDVEHELEGDRAFEVNMAAVDEYSDTIAAARAFENRNRGAVQVYHSPVQSFVQQPPGLRVWATVVIAWGQWRRYVRAAKAQREVMRRAYWHASESLLRRVVYHWRLVTPSIRVGRRLYSASRVRGVLFSSSLGM